METFHKKSFSTMARAAIVKIKLCYNNVPFLKYCEMSLKEYTFCNDNI